MHGHDDWKTAEDPREDDVDRHQDGIESARESVHEAIVALRNAKSDYEIAARRYDDDGTECDEIVDAMRMLIDRFGEPK